MLILLNAAEPPERLLTYLENNLGKGALRARRRTVLNKTTAGPWQLVCCVVEVFPRQDQTPDAVATRRYATTILHEDWLDGAACRTFLEDIQTGKATFDDVVVDRKATPSWQLELVPLKNYFMRAAGYVAHTAFDANVATLQEPLIAPREPFYPDQAEAARDWSGLATYQGQSDSRNREIVFLMPEARALFTRAVSDHGTLRLTVGGVQHANLSLLVKGAYWTKSTIHHFEGAVSDGGIALSVPDHVDRLEYVLIDDGGEIYDYQFETWSSHSGLVRERMGNDADRLTQLVHNACATGEGLYFEFKPLIDLREGLGAQGKKTKYRELVRTIVAFANSEGGSVFLGIDDNCNVTGIGEPLRAFGKAELSDELFASYRGALLSAVRGDLVGEVPLRISPIVVDDVLVAVVEVPSADAVPIMVRGENVYYVRVGASNRQLPPNEWAAMQAARTASGSAFSMPSEFNG
ncbi:MAG: ATP-binding protein [Rhizomicrobium sp.]